MKVLITILVFFCLLLKIRAQENQLDSFNMNFMTDTLDTSIFLGLPYDNEVIRNFANVGFDTYNLQNPELLGINGLDTRLASLKWPSVRREKHIKFDHPHSLSKQAPNWRFSLINDVVRQ